MTVARWAVTRLQAALIPILALSFAVGAAVFPAVSAAHLLPAQTATVHLVGDSAYVVVAAPLSGFASLEGAVTTLTAEQLPAHRDALAQEFQQRWQLSDGTVPGRALFTWVLNPDPTVRQGSDYVVVMQRVMFAKPPEHLRLHTDLFGHGAGQDRMTLRASHDGQAQIIVLSASNSSYELFPAPWNTFIAFLRVGVEHILLGADHLLFLLTIVTAAAGWRYWIGVISSFTVAHSITLSLAVFGIVHVAPAIVEPAIAASIVLMAVANLIRASVNNRARIAVVFACGLLHGLGFASALSEVGVDASHRLATLAGFNLGVEIGQFVFLGVVLCALMAVRRLLPPRLGALGPRAASWTAAAAGVLLFCQRLLPAL